MGQIRGKRHEEKSSIILNIRHKVYIPWTGDLRIIIDNNEVRFFSVLSLTYFRLCEMHFRILALEDQKFNFVCLRPNLQFGQYE